MLAVALEKQVVAAMSSASCEGSSASGGEFITSVASVAEEKSAASAGDQEMTT